MDRLRVDKWLWAARFFKTRSIAKTAIEGGKVHLDGQRVKVSREISIGETAALIAEAMAVSIEIENDAQQVRPRESEVERLFADTQNAKNRFDWSPAFEGRAGFIRGLSETALWFQDAENLSRYKSMAYNL